MRRLSFRGCKPNRLPGGKAASRRPSDFDPVQLHAGALVEFEHTKDPCVAREIAMDHLTERWDYYIRLRKMERLPILKRRHKAIKRKR